MVSAAIIGATGSHQVLPKGLARKCPVDTFAEAESTDNTNPPRIDAAEALSASPETPEQTDV